MKLDLKEWINKITSFIYQSEIIVYAEGTGASGWCRAFKQGNTVRFYYWYRNNSMSSSTVMFTLPVGYRPYGDYGYPIVYAGGYAYYGIVSSDGKIRQAAGSTNQVFGVGEFRLVER